MLRLIKNNIFLQVFIIITSAVLCYSSSFSVPFHFDDDVNIINNPAIKSLDGLKGNVSVGEHLDRGLRSRWLGYVSFAFNYYLHGTAVLGYHLVNLTIHIIASLSVYWLLTLLLKISPKEELTMLPFFTALIFAVHPVQTQAVTYIVQRFTSMSAMFYLLSIVMYVKFRLSADGSWVKKALLMSASVLCAVSAMKTKEIAFTLPIMATLIELTFFKATLKGRLLNLLPLALTLPIIPLTYYQFYSFLDAPKALDYASKLDLLFSRWQYLFTQFVVIMQYIRLFFPPVYLSIDYDFEIYKSLFDPVVLACAGFHLALIGTAVYVLWQGCRRADIGFKLIGIGVLWFYIALSVESSIIPINDVIFEHRVYLPAVGFLTAICALLLMLYSKIPQERVQNVAVIFVIGIISLLAITTYMRNITWQSRIDIWYDAIQKHPNKPRLYTGLAEGYLLEGYYDEAENLLKRILEKFPLDDQLHTTLGLVYVHKGMPMQAKQSFKNAIKLNPQSEKAYNNLGCVLLDEARFDEALTYLLKGLAISPHSEEINFNVAVAYFYLKQYDKAKDYFTKVLTLNRNHIKSKEYLMQINSIKLNAGK